jgi:hypothetical protein
MVSPGRIAILFATSACDWRVSPFAIFEGNVVATAGVSSESEA